MKIVQRANKQLSIPDDKLSYYISQGYHEVKTDPVKSSRKSEKKNE